MLNSPAPNPKETTKNTSETNRLSLTKTQKRKKSGAENYNTLNFTQLIPFKKGKNKERQSLIKDIFGKPKNDKYHEVEEWKKGKNRADSSEICRKVKSERHTIREKEN